MTVKRVLFVCTGNICRSPLAEALLRREIEHRGLSGAIDVDSAGTDADHLAEQSDSRMRRTAAAHGLRIDHRARRITRDDLTRFDVIVGMDDHHLARVRRLAGTRPPESRPPDGCRPGGGRPELRKLGEFDPKATGTGATDVPDPWYGGMDGFERVYTMVERMIPALVDHLAGAAEADER